MDAEIEESGWQTCYSVHHSLNTIHCIAYTIHCTLYTVLYTLYTVSCTLYTVHHTLDTVHCTLFTIHCSLYSVYCKLNTVHLKKKCPFCREKLLKMEVKESMNKVHDKVPVKLVKFTFKGKEFDKRFFKSLLIAKHFPKHNMSVFSALKYSHHLKSIQDTLRNKIKINPEKIFSSNQPTGPIRSSSRVI